jgi:GT2 family glycosyltransferase
VEVLRVFPNAGYAHGANEAIRDARRRSARYIALMNDDIAILHSEWLREAVMHAERDRRIGIIGFVETASDEGAQLAPESKLTDFEYLGSAILVIPIEMFDRVGMLDEVYFVGGDESELGVRAQAAGYRAVKLGIPIYHFGGGTIKNFSRSMAYMDMRNGIRYCLKNRSLKRAFLRAVRILEVACNPWPVTLDDRDPAHSRMRNSGNVVVNLLLWLRAVSWNIVYFPQTYRIRAAERKLIRAARAEWNDLNATANNGASRPRQPGNSPYSGAEMGDRI